MKKLNELRNIFNPRVSSFIIDFKHLENLWAIVKTCTSISSLLTLLKQNILDQWPIHKSKPYLHAKEVLLDF